MRKFAILILIAGTAGLTACEEDPVEPEFGLDQELFDDFDADADGFLDDVEFTAGFEDEDVFGDLDADADGFLSEDEFDNDLGEFDDFDANQDTVLNEDEFIGGTFDVFDTDADSLVDEDEFGIGADLF